MNYFAILMLVVTIGLTACGSKEKKPGQSLVRVDGEEITVLQLNDELQRANIQPAQQGAASKELLESLIERQLIVAEAKRNRLDRTPEVVQAIERAKMQIIAQAYMESISTRVSKPSKSEIEEYYQKHPELFARRKQFDMTSILIASKDFNDELKSVMASANSLNSVMSWMDGHNMQYKRGHLSRTTVDLSPEMSAKLQSLPKGRLLVVDEETNTMIISLVAIRSHPVTAKEAESEIERYLINAKSNDLANAEIAHLRALAKIEYLNARPTTKVLTPSGTKPEGAAKSGH